MHRLRIELKFSVAKFENILSHSVLVHYSMFELQESKELG